MGRGERRCIRKGRQWFTRVTERVHTGSRKCVTKHRSRKAAGANLIVSDFMKYGEGVLTMMVLLYDWIWTTSTHLRGGEE